MHIEQAEVDRDLGKILSLRVGDQGVFHGAHVRLDALGTEEVVWIVDVLSRTASALGDDNPRFVLRGDSDGYFIDGRGRWLELDDALRERLTRELDDVLTAVNGLLEIFT